MPPISPRLALLLPLGIAAVLLGLAPRMARREEIGRVERDRQPLQRFAAEAQTELDRLEQLYETHLSNLARSIAPEPFAIRRAADRIVGLRQISLLHRDTGPGGRDLHVLISAAPDERPLIPSLARQPAPSTGKIVMLDPRPLLGETGLHSGWIEPPGAAPMFWERRAPDQVAVFTVDPDAVRVAMDQSFASWIPARLEQVRVAGGPDLVRTQTGAILAHEGHPPEMDPQARPGRPDFLLPIRNRFGTWEIASWDRRETRVHHDAPTLAVTCAVAVVIALLGLLLHAQQHRSLTLAARRASFVNRVSHELRSPLTNILLNIDLADDAAPRHPDETSRRLALVRQEAGRLARIVDNVLTFSRAERGGLQTRPSPCSPHLVVGAILEQFAPLLARRGLEIRAPLQPVGPCMLDPDALAAIVANLLSNVEKYVPSGTVDLSVTLAAGTLTLTVADEGPGIPAHAVERVFRPFERLSDTLDRGTTGAGLGLAISRDLATAMGGSLHLVPSARGARFELRIPAPPAPPPSALAAV